MSCLLPVINSGTAYAGCMSAIAPGRVRDAVADILSHRRPPQFSPLAGVTVGVISNNGRPEVLAGVLRAVQTAAKLAPWPVQIILCGVGHAPEGVEYLPDPENAAAGFLGGLRNRISDASRHDTAVFIDDDIFLTPGFFVRLDAYARQFGFDVAGCPVLQADGTVLVGRGRDYDPYFPTDVQTGALAIVRRKVLERVRWDGSIPFYAGNRGGVNEDVEWSRRLHAAGHGLHFDWGNLVYHCDRRTERGTWCGGFKAVWQ